MDNGEVIPGLNEDWTLGGAKLFEWMAGFMMLIVCQELLFTEKVARSMPMLMVVWVLTTFGLAGLRRLYPDEERGLRNQACVSVGIPPPGIPAPAALQPIWSASPMRELDSHCMFAQLNLDVVFVEEESVDSQKNDSSKNRDPRSGLAAINAKGFASDEA